MQAFKFLRSGGVGPFTAHAWPLPHGSEPGAWVEADAVDPCRRGVHACAPDDLPYWIQEELWEIELEGDVQRVGHKLVARRGRLVRRVETWNADSARDFSLACAARVAGYATGSPDLAGHASDASVYAQRAHAAVTGFIASRTAELSGGVAAYDAERSAQVAWLAEHLGLRRA